VVKQQAERIRELLGIFRDDNPGLLGAVPVPADTREKYRGLFPDSLLSLWKEDGWTGYGNGRWWTVNPAQFDTVLAEWLAGTPFAAIDRFHCFARSAFGKLHAWGEKLGNHLTVDCANGFIVALPAEMGVPEPDPELAMATHLSFMTPDSADLEGDDGELLFDAAVRKLGPLTADEVYGFEPALALGGAAVVDSIRRMRIDVHLSLLRQIEAPRTPGF
jgi:hypothetical protein